MPEMALHFATDGTARFQGGFEFYNPVRWRYDAAEGVLRLRMARLTPDDLAVFEDGVARGHAREFRWEDSTLALALTPETQQLWISGFYFDRQPGDFTRAGNLTRR